MQNNGPHAEFKAFLEISAIELKKFNAQFNKGKYTEAIAKDMLAVMHDFINNPENIQKARENKDALMSIIGKLESNINNKTQVFDIRPLLYDIPNNSDDKWRNEFVNINKQPYPVFNLPDTHLSLSAGTAADKKQDFFNALQNNSVKHVLAIGRTDSHYGIYSDESYAEFQRDNKNPPTVFQNPDFADYFSQGEIVNKVGRIITYKIQNGNEEQFVHNFTLKNKGVAHLTFEETAYIASLHQQCLEQDNRMLVHCKGGTGRTGAMIATLLAQEPVYQNLGFDGALNAYATLRSQAKFGSATEEQSQRDDAKMRFNQIQRAERHPEQISQEKKQFLQAFSKVLQSVNTQQAAILKKNPDFAKHDNPLEMGRILDAYTKKDFAVLQDIATKNGAKGKYNQKNQQITFPYNNQMLTINLRDIAKLAELSQKKEAIYQCDNVTELNRVTANKIETPKKTRASEPQILWSYISKKMDKYEEKKQTKKANKKSEVDVVFKKQDKSLLTAFKNNKVDKPSPEKEVDNTVSKKKRNRK